MRDNMLRAVRTETAEKLIAQALQTGVRNTGEKVDPGFPAFVEQNRS